MDFQYNKKFLNRFCTAYRQGTQAVSARRVITTFCTAYRQGTQAGSARRVITTFNGEGAKKHHYESLYTTRETVATPDDDTLLQ